MTPAAARAQYSPRLSPAATSGLIPFSSRTRIMAMLAVTMAAWVDSVISSLSFSLKAQLGHGKPINPLLPCQRFFSGLSLLIEILAHSAGLRAPRPGKINAILLIPVISLSSNPVPIKAVRFSSPSAYLPVP